MMTHEVTLALRMPKELKYQLMQEASRKRMSLSAYMRTIIEARNGKNQPADSDQK